jgi:hypothetical protein
MSAGEKPSSGAGNDRSANELAHMAEFARRQRPRGRGRTLHRPIRVWSPQGRLHPMRLVGDQRGIAALKELVVHHRDYLRFLLVEAGSNTDHAASFRDADGTRWQLVHRPVTGELEIRRAAS